MNGARALVRTLLGSGVDVCFANPGTSEMHFVAALDAEPGMRCVLGLFEGVVTGAADGYARMAGRPACTLLHLGPGLGNGLANLHNARRARVPVVNLVGEHATYHLRLDAPLTSDIESLAKTVSGWVRTAQSPETVAEDGSRAVAASYGPPPQIATLILPADIAWTEGVDPADPVTPREPLAPPSDRIEEIARVLREDGEGAALLMNGSALGEEGLASAGRIAAGTGARLLTDTFVTRQAHGAGRVSVPRIPYVVRDAVDVLEGLRHMVLVETTRPVAFFAYPHEPGELTPDGCVTHTLAGVDEDGREALSMLAEALDVASTPAPAEPLERPSLPSGPLTPSSIAQTLAHVLPENAIVMNEGVTTGRLVCAALERSAPHDWLDHRGGAIGQGMPAATGAAIACPDRRVLSLEADGSGMYTLQALWTQAREGLDVTTVIFSNRKYAILEAEYRHVGAGEPSQRAQDLFDLSRPSLDWVGLAAGLGVKGTRVSSAEELGHSLARAVTEPGPYLIEALL